MNGIEQIDLTGRDPTERDIEDAVQAVKAEIGIDSIMKLPPMMAVNMPNILRCLTHYQAVMKLLRPKA